MNGDHWTGDEWRWHTAHHNTAEPATSIGYIEPADEPQDRDGDQPPFGFARALDPAPADLDDMVVIW